VSEPTAGEKGLTTETQRSQRRKICSWPGDDGQEQVPPPSAEALLAGNQTVSERTVMVKDLIGGQRSFARSPSPDRAKKIYSVLSVPLWLIRN